jgi:hypothetical protein
VPTARSSTSRCLLSTEPWVREEAAEISQATPHAAMQGCDGRFEVSFESLDEAPD